MITTECGKLLVPPGEIVVIPQGFRFAVDLPDGPSRGYVSEIFGTHFQLPDLGPIGNTSAFNLSAFVSFFFKKKEKYLQCKHTRFMLLEDVRLVCRCKWLGFGKGFPFPNSMV